MEICESIRQMTWADKKAR